MGIEDEIKKQCLRRKKEPIKTDNWVKKDVYDELIEVEQKIKDLEEILFPKDESKTAIPEGSDTEYKNLLNRYEELKKLAGDTSI